ncbi:flap structure-specific endonuclease [Coprinopsis cinerea AmutBmut pab1-1]|nr:flap structure-specific endonuclease [Coprinopsis cinerea AmutBmut pab1-1]
MVVGVDAESWMYATEMAITRSIQRGASLASLGKNPALFLLFKRLSLLAKSPAVFIFVFDGPHRPSVKRGTSVRPVDHWMVEDFERLISAFGFYSFKAPGEAEAELGWWSDQNWVDFIWTEDSDVFAFGGLNVLRTSRQESADELPTTVDVFTEGMLKEKSDGVFDRGAFILLAILLGGDYEQAGLKGCGTATAMDLCRTLSIKALYSTIDDLHPAQHRKYLSTWRQCLRDILSKNPEGTLHRRQPSLASNISTSFPSLKTINLYTYPTTSNTSDNPYSPPNPAEWLFKLPDTAALSAASWELFNCHEPVSLCRKYIWPAPLRGSCVAVAQSLSLSEGMGVSSIAHIITSKNKIGTTTSLDDYQIDVRPTSAVRAAVNVVMQKLHLDQPPHPVDFVFPIRFWIPGPILENVAPDKVADFYRSRRRSRRVPIEPYIPIMVFPQPVTAPGSTPLTILSSLSSSPDPPSLSDILKDLGT